MGEVFAGRYELIDPIGRGGVGRVWRAWDERRQRYVAAKVLQQSDAHTLLRFVREQALRIDHPHVLAPASWAADDDKVLFTMDLVAGGSLAQLVADHGPLPPRLVCTLLDQLLAGLAAVHAEDVVHRDVKPANVLLEPTGRGLPHLRLSDFGIAVRPGDAQLTGTDHVMGTPGYFAPEQMFSGEADFTTDLYAVGLVGLYLLTGVRPDSRAVLARYEHGMPAAPEGVPEPLWQVLGGLLQPDRGLRFRTATGTRKALAGAAELLDGSGTAASAGAAGAGPVEIVDRIGPLPEGYGPGGPLHRRSPGPADGSLPGHHCPALPTPVHGPVAPSHGPAAPPQAPSPRQVPPVPPPGPSTTGSFPLAPPQPPPSQLPPSQLPTPPRTPPTPVPSVSAPAHPADPGTQVTVPTARLGAAPPPGGPGRVPGSTPGSTPAPVPEPARSPARHGGPPAKVAVPLLVFALLCLALGVWALTAAS